MTRFPLFIALALAVKDEVVVLVVVLVVVMVVMVVMVAYLQKYN